MPVADRPQELVLPLRCRDAEWLDLPETLDAFARPAQGLRPAQRDADLVELLIADVVARGLFAVEGRSFGRPLLSCETARFGIPLGVRDPEQPPIHDWRARGELQGELLEARERERESVRSVSFRLVQGLIAAAGAVPLMLAPALVHAGAPGQVDNLEWLGAGRAFAPPKGKTKPAPAPAEAEPAPEPELAPQPEPAPQPVPPPTPTIVMPQVDQSLSLTGRNLWVGLDGKSVTLTMKDGQTLSGKVVAQSGNDLAIGRSSDGTVVAVPKSEIAGVQLRAGATQTTSSSAATLMGPRTREDGFKLHVGGVAMVTLGSVATLSGAVMLAITPYFVAISLPLLLPGLAMIGGSVSLFRTAKRKRKAFNNAWGLPEMSKVQVWPTMGVARNGGQAGLVLRF